MQSEIKSSPNHASIALSHGQKGVAFNEAFKPKQLNFSPATNDTIN